MSKPIRTSIVHLKLRLEEDLVKDLGLRAGKTDKLIKLIQRTSLADLIEICVGVRIVSEHNGKNDRVEVIGV